MKKHLFLCVMILSACVSFAQTRIAVLPFSAGENVAKSDMIFLTEEFIMQMVNSGKYIVLERMQLDKAMKELQLQNSDDFDETQAAEVGKLAGAEQVFFGSIYRVSEQYNVTVRCVDIQTGAITFAKKGVSPDKKTLTAVCKKMALQIIGGDFASTVKIELTAKERLIKEKYLDLKWGISATNKEDMTMQFKRNFACGITLAAVGGTHLLGGLIMTAVMCSPVFPQYTGGYSGENGSGSYYSVGWDPVCIIIGCVVGIQLILSGIIITPICALPLKIAKNVKSIYEKSTGEKLLAFLRRTSFGGGYDWDNKEVTVAMAIRL